MENFQIVIQSNCHKDFFMAHVTESYMLNGYSYACILDIRLPEYRVCRNVGFSFNEVKEILSNVKENMDKIKKAAETKELLVFDEFTDIMEPLREDVLKTEEI